MNLLQKLNGSYLSSYIEQVYITKEIRNLDGVLQRQITNLSDMLNKMI